MHPFTECDNIGTYLIGLRSFVEYRAMFSLTDADLLGRVLDCPGGGASFTATARARGADVVAVDPVYATRYEELLPQLDVELERGAAWALDRSPPTSGVSTGTWMVTRRCAVRPRDCSLRTGQAHPGRYVAASLPSLPFRDSNMDLVLSSHLLFTYADRLDASFHLSALQEMARVTRGQVRVYALVDQLGLALDGLVDDLIAALAASALPARVVDVEYEFQRGARSMLLIDAHGDAQVRTAQPVLATRPS